MKFRGGERRLENLLKRKSCSKPLCYFLLWIGSGSSVFELLIFPFCRTFSLDNWFITICSTFCETEQRNSLIREIVRKICLMDLPLLDLDLSIYFYLDNIYNDLPSICYTCCISPITFIRYILSRIIDFLSNVPSRCNVLYHHLSINLRQISAGNDTLQYRFFKLLVIFFLFANVSVSFLTEVQVDAVYS